MGSSFVLKTNNAPKAETSINVINSGVLALSPVLGVATPVSGAIAGLLCVDVVAVVLCVGAATTVKVVVALPPRLFIEMLCVPTGKDAAVVCLDSMLDVYYEGKQIDLHRISYQKKDMMVNANHYRKMTVKQSFDIENTLLDQTNLIDLPVQTPNLSAHDEIVEVHYE